MDKIIDKLILEWSWRCEKGYPDINNPADKKVLEKLLAEYGVSLNTFIKEQDEEKKEEFTVDSLVKLLQDKGNTLSPDKIEKLYKVIDKTGKQFGGKLQKRLQEKKLGDEQISAVLGYADRKNIEDQILASNENTDNTFSRLPTQGNLVKELTSISQLDSQHVDYLVNLTVGAGQKGVGRGEIALVSLLYDVSSASKGDIQVGKQSIEVKASSTKANGGLSGFMLTNVRTRGEGIESIKNRIAKYFKKPRPDEGVKLTWIEIIYQLASTKEQIQEVLNDLYKGEFSFKIENYPTSSKELTLEITRQLAEEYFKSYNPILMISKERDYKIFTTVEDLKNSIGTTITILSFSDLAPRLIFSSNTQT